MKAGAKGLPGSPLQIIEMGKNWGFMLVQGAFVAYSNERTSSETIMGGFMHSFVYLKILYLVCHLS